MFKNPGRDTMNQTLDLWKKVDAGDLYEASSQTQSRSSIGKGLFFGLMRLSD